MIGNVIINRRFHRFRDDPERPDAGVPAPTPSLTTKP
jgi:hypothetical protein